MKKLIIFLVIIVMLTTLIACGTADVAEEIVEEVISEVEETPAEEAPLDEAPTDSMRPEFKTAMDSYEAFYEEYCSFMKKYMENPTDLTLLGEYTDMMSKSLEVSQDFEAWNETDMNDAELSYYLEVSSRVAQKLLEVTQ